jgi:hypothetical protein
VVQISAQCMLRADHAASATEAIVFVCCLMTLTIAEVERTSEQAALTVRCVPVGTEEEHNKSVSQHKLSAGLGLYVCMGFGFQLWPGQLQCDGRICRCRASSPDPRCLSVLPVGSAVRYFLQVRPCLMSTRHKGEWGSRTSVIWRPVVSLVPGSHVQCERMMRCGVV